MGLTMNAALWGGSLVAAYVIGEALGLKGEETKQRNTFRLLRLLNYLCCFGFMWSSFRLASTLRAGAAIDADTNPPSSGLGVKLLWVACLVYFFGFFGVTFVDKDSTPIDSSGAEQDDLKKIQKQAVKKQLARFSDAWIAYQIRAGASCVLCNLAITHFCMHVAFDLFFIAPLLVLAKFIAGRALFNRLSTQLLQHWTEPMLMTLFSWTGTRVFVDDMDLWESSKRQGNLLTLSNHGSRVDWAVGILIGSACGFHHRVGFVAEAVMKYMPIIGWFRNLLDLDMYVSQGLHGAKEAIQGTLRQLRSTKTKVLYFLCPEGHIADPNTLSGEYYTSHCQAFCEQNGFKPFDYVLTPRPKGLGTLAEHVSGGGTIVSMTMAFEREGTLLNEKLLSPNRVVPDLYTLYDGILCQSTDIYISVRKLKFDATTSQDNMKKIMLTDYSQKDAEMKHFHEHGRFTTKPRDAMVSFQLPHTRINIIVLLHNAALFFAGTQLGLLPFFAWCALAIFVALSSGCVTGYLVSGRSMESLPFETAFKAIMTYRYDQKVREIRFKQRINGEIA